MTVDCFYNVVYLLVDRRHTMWRESWKLSHEVKDSMWWSCMQRTDSHRALIKWKAANVSRHLELSTESACRMIGWQQGSFRGTLEWFWRVTVLTFLQSENLLRRTGEASGCSSDSSKANRKSGGGGAPPQTSCNSKTITFKRIKTFVLQALSKLLLTVSVVFWLQTPHQDGPLAVYHGPAQHITF